MLTFVKNFAIYFLILLYISQRSLRKGGRGNNAFFRAGRQSSWWMVAIGMIGGLALGTLVTLGLIPLLYEVLFGMKWPGSKRSHEAVQQPVQPV